MELSEAGTVGDSLDHVEHLEGYLAKYLGKVFCINSDAQILSSRLQVTT